MRDLAAQDVVVTAHLDYTSMCEAELKSQALLIEKLQSQLRGQRATQFGPKSETMDQLGLKLEEEETAKAAELGQANENGPTLPVQPEPKGKPTRRPLPSSLPRNEEMLSPADACDCGGAYRTIGEDATEEQEYIPGRFVVNRYVRPRVVCTCCNKITQAPLPSRPTEKGRPGPGLLAHVMISKYGDHLRSVIGRVWSMLNIQRAGPCFCPWSARRHKMRTMEVGWLLSSTSGSWHNGLIRAHPVRRPCPGRHTSARRRRISVIFVAPLRWRSGFD